MEAEKLSRRLFARETFCEFLVDSVERTVAEKHADYFGLFRFGVSRQPFQQLGV